MQQAFQNAGSPLSVFAGDIWVIADQAVTFADPNPATRTIHDTRYVLVMQGDDQGENHRCQTVLVAPLSSNVVNQRSWEARLEPGESGLTKPSIVKIHLMQPIPRRVLIPDGAFVRAIPDAALDRIRIQLLLNLGIS